MDIEDTLGSSFRSLKLSSVDIFIDKVECNGDIVFNSFEMYDHSHVVGVDLMKEIVMFARGSFDMTVF